MSRFEDFEKLERRVIREALTGAQSEFYDPGHTQEDRDTLDELAESGGFQEAEPISGPESDEDAEPGENETEE